MTVVHYNSSMKKKIDGKGKIETREIIVVIFIFIFESFKKVNQ